jgi:hypothetical protein
MTVLPWKSIAETSKGEFNGPATRRIAVPAPRTAAIASGARLRLSRKLPFSGPGARQLGAWRSRSRDQEDMGFGTCAGASDPACGGVGPRWGAVGRAVAHYTPRNRWFELHVFFSNVAVKLVGSNTWTDVR